MIGRLQSVIIDCPDPRSLADFYEQLLGLPRTEDTPEWVTLSSPSGGPTVALQRVAGYQAPSWSADGPPQQMHLDVLVGDLNVGEEQVLALGASLLEGSDKPIGFRVYADPVGHPFCLVTPEALG
ncbi:MAG: VOC family protein [Actinobacteria bacterium]|nr:VOC family protein [Actinomycetota bacterium]